MKTEQEFDYNTTIGAVGCDHEFEVFMMYDDFQDWINGRKSIQDAMPYLPQEMRGLLISRKCPICSGAKSIQDFVKPFEQMKQKRTLMVKTRRGPISFETDMTDEEAKARIIELVFQQRAMAGEFEIDMAITARDKKPTPVQIAWMHKLVIDYDNPKQKGVMKAKLGNMERIYKMLEHAKQFLDYPKIRIENNGIGIALGIFTDRSKHKGQIIVKTFEPFQSNGNHKWNRKTNEYLGRIDKEGRWYPAMNTPEEITGMLLKFAEDPEGEAARYGRLTGHCCFCHLPLSDPRSTDVGYGQTCAKHYGLAWGN